MPVSSSTVATQIVLVPDMPGYSTCSMMTKPASASGRVGGRITLQQSAGVAARLAQHQLAQPVAVIAQVAHLVVHRRARARRARRRRSPGPARRTRARRQAWIILARRIVPQPWLAPPLQSAIGPALPSAKRYQFITSAVREKVTCCLTSEKHDAKETRAVTKPTFIPVIANGQFWPMTPAIPDLRQYPPTDYDVLHRRATCWRGQVVCRTRAWQSPIG